MDGEFILLIFKIIIFLPFILFLLYLSLRYGGSKLRKLQDGRYMKVLDRVALSKENNIVVVKIGDKAYAMSSCTKEIKILFELPKEEIVRIEGIKEIPQYEDMKELFKKYVNNNKLFKKYIDKKELLKKHTFKKEVKDEKEK
ncbi:flagellar biosynthetic protein FliO [Clostridium psychrophilum]|uniref:flagellar biosynthetic protein FliO n=1 Tax=Clostridium psychrophilum TaxID=132926 RepID=UPI001C0CD293|nr:flagellar biosynthetic protein FliO [Clostridium psychrophilum]MBU3180634.1 flagellar biosynthetic protein FliO [Clostridium psychrophilum]